jgi:hypothetical protein
MKNGFNDLINFDDFSNEQERESLRTQLTYVIDKIRNEIIS